MQRRTLLKFGLGATVVLVVAGGGIALLQPGVSNGRLGEGARAVMRAIAITVLDGALPAPGTDRERALDEHLIRLEATIAAFPESTRGEISRLLALLASAPGRVALVGLGTQWPDASVTQVHTALQGLRLSSLALKQQAYHALRDLTNAAYFSDPSAWAHMGYPGPMDI